MRQWETLLESEQSPYTVVVEKTWEEVSPGDYLDLSEQELVDTIDRIDQGLLDWFTLRVRILGLHGVELARTTVGGFLYEDAQEVVRDGTVQDLIKSTVEEAGQFALELRKWLAGLDLTESQ